MLLVLIVVISRIVLDCTTIEKSLEKPVIVGHHIEAELGGIECIHPRNTGLRQMGYRTQSMLMGLVN